MRAWLFRGVETITFHHDLCPPLGRQVCQPIPYHSPVLRSEVQVTDYPFSKLPSDDKQDPGLSDFLRRLMEPPWVETPPSRPTPPDKTPIEEKQAELLDQACKENGVLHSRLSTYEDAALRLKARIKDLESRLGKAEEEIRALRGVR